MDDSNRFSKYSVDRETGVVRPSGSIETPKTEERPTIDRNRIIKATQGFGKYSKRGDYVERFEELAELVKDSESGKKIAIARLQSQGFPPEVIEKYIQVEG